MKQIRLSVFFLLAFLLLSSFLHAADDLEYAFSLFERGAYKLAYQTFQTILLNESGMDGSDEVIWYMALCRFHLAQYASSRDILMDLLKSFPVSSYRIRAILLLSDIDALEGRKVEAIRGYLKLIRKYPGTEEAFSAQMSMARIYTELERYEDAVEIYQELLKGKFSERKIEVQFALADQYKTRGLLDDAVSWNKEVVFTSTQPADLAKAQYRIADIRLEQKQYAEAAERFGKLLERYPEYTDKDKIQYKIGYCYQQMNDLEKSLAVYGLVGKSSPELVRLIQYRRSQIFTLQGKKEEALPLLKSLSTNTQAGAIKENVLQDLVILEMDLKFFDQALLSTERIEDRKFVLMNRGRILFLLKRYDEALAEYTAYLSDFSSDKDVERVFFFTGQLYFVLENYKKALVFLDRIYENYPNSLFLNESLYLSGRSHLFLGEYDLSLVLFNRLLERTDNPLWKERAKEGIGQAFFMKGRYKDAADVFLSLAGGAVSNQSYYYYQAASAFIELNDFSRAENILIQSLRSGDPDDPWFERSFLKMQDLLSSSDRDRDYVDLFAGLLTRMSGQRQKQETGLAILERYFRLNDQAGFDQTYQAIGKMITEPDLKARALTLKGKSFFNRGEYARSLDVFTSVQSNYSSLPEGKYALYEIAQSELKLGRLEQALHYFDLFIESKTDQALSENIFYDLGMYYFRNKEYQKARQNFSKLLLNFPRSALSDDAQYRFALSWYSTRDYEKSVSEFKILLKSFPGSEYADDSLFRLGEAHYKIKDYAQAVYYYKKLLKDYPETSLESTARYQLAMSYRKMNNMRAAVDLFNQIMGQERDDLYDLRSRFELGLYYKSERNYEKAVSLLVKVTSKDTEIRWEAVYHLAESYRFLRDYGLARSQYAKLILQENAEYLPESLYYMGFCSEKLGETDKAVNYYRKTAERFNGTEWADRARVKTAKLGQED